MNAVLLDLMFMYTHPRIKLEYIPFEPPGDVYRETLMAAIAEGTAPSIIAAGDPYFGGDVYTDAKEGILADITDYVKEWKRFEKIPKVAWDACEVQGRFYAFPGVFEYNSGFMYRKDWFKEAGIFNAAGEAAPPDNWTMEDFLDISMKIAGLKEDRYACNVGPETRIQPGDTSAFGDFGVKPDPTGKYTWRVDFDTPGKRYFEWLRRLIKSGSVLYGIDIGGSEDTWDFYGGRTAMRLAGWPVMYLAGATGQGIYPPGVDQMRDIGGLKYPAGPEGIVPNSLSYSLFGVLGTHTEEEIAACMEWIRWCIDEDPNPVMEQQALSWWMTTLGGGPGLPRFWANVIERPPVDVYDHVVDIPGLPKDWTGIEGVEPYLKLNAEIRALPFKPLPQTYGVYIPVFETKLRPVFELILSDPDADFENELSKAAHLIASFTKRKKTSGSLSAGPESTT